MKVITKYIIILKILLIIAFLSSNVSAQENKKKNISIYQFENIKEDPNYSYLSTSIPNMIYTLLNELNVFNLNKGGRQTDITDEKALTQAFKENQDILIIGSFITEAENLTLNLKVYDVKGKRLFFEYKQSFPLDQEIFEQVDAFTKKVIEETSIILIQERFYEYDSTPTIKWFPKPGALKYSLIFDNNEIFKGEATEFTFKEEVKQGKHEYYINYDNADGSTEKSKKYYLEIRYLQPTKFKDLATDTYMTKPLIKWEQNKGADIYQVFVDDKEIYKGIDPVYQFTEPLAFGEHKFKMITSNPHQTSKSDIKINLLKISPIHITSPSDGASFPLADDTMINISWTKASPNAEYEILIDNKKITKTKNLSYTYSPNGEHFSEGQHTITINATQNDQSTNTNSTYNINKLEFLNANATVGIATLNAASGRKISPNFYFTGSIRLFNLPMLISFKTGGVIFMETVNTTANIELKKTMQIIPILGGVTYGLPITNEMMFDFGLYIGASVINMKYQETKTLNISDTSTIIKPTVLPDISFHYFFLSNFSANITVNSIFILEKEGITSAPSVNLGVRWRM